MGTKKRSRLEKSFAPWPDGLVGNIVIFDTAGAAYMFNRNHGIEKYIQP